MSAGPEAEVVMVDTTTGAAQPKPVPVGDGRVEPGAFATAVVTLG